MLGRLIATTDGTIRLRAGRARKPRGVTAIIIFGLAVAVVIGLSLTFGGAILGAILAGVIIVGGIIWFFAMGASKTTPGEVVRESDEQEFLGPGGPDDPR